MNHPEAQERFVVQGISMPVSLKQRVQRAARRKKWPVSLVAREALELWLRVNGEGDDDARKVS